MHKHSRRCSTREAAEAAVCTLKERCSKAKDTALQHQLAIGRQDKKHQDQVTDPREQVAGLEGTATSAG